MGQRQINIETTSCISTLEFTTSSQRCVFNVDVSNVRQRRNNVVLFNVEFHNVGQCGNNVMKMTISKKKKKSFQME